MNPRAAAMILGACATAWLASQYGPVLLEKTGLGEFGIVGQLCFAVLGLSVLERVFARL